MKRLLLNVAALAIIAVGGSYLAPSAEAGPTPSNDLQAKCGQCEGDSCGFDSNGNCWAADN